jgi:hypothetical protein
LQDRRDAHRIFGTSETLAPAGVSSNLKREILNHLFFCKKYSPDNHLEYLKNVNGSVKSNFKDWLLGNISFIYSIEPEIGKKMYTKINDIDWGL